MKISLKEFMGIRPRSSDQLLDQRQSVTAQNCDLMAGNMRPLEAPAYADAAPAGTKSIYYYNGRYLTWTSVVHVPQRAARVADLRFTR